MDVRSSEHVRPQTRLLMSGGGGRLGQELGQVLLQMVRPSRHEMDIMKPETIRAAIEQYRPVALVHAAAYTDVAGAEQHPATCWDVNVQGTVHMVQAAQQFQLPLIHISTDYVFWGDEGGYREEDPPGPVRNYYSLTKLVAEGLVRVLPRHLVIRTSFRPRKWSYPKAFTDVYTSQDYVDRIAPEIALAIQHMEEIPYHTLHIVGQRTSVYDLARQRAPNVIPASKTEAPVALPDDISLNIDRWTHLKSTWKS